LRISGSERRSKAIGSSTAVGLGRLISNSTFGVYTVCLEMAQLGRVPPARAFLPISLNYYDKSWLFDQSKGRLCSAIPFLLLQAT
jgi:hypothetical protein